MALKIWNYNAPLEYIYDPSKVEISGGVGKLFLKPFLTSDIYACWHMNEVSGVTAADSSGNNRNGTLVNDPAWATGKLNNCLQLAATKYVNCGNIMDFERTVPFSVECWIKITSSGLQMLFTRTVQ